jgi:hypothetical protein
MSRRCPNCDEFLPHNNVECPHCYYVDVAWQDNLSNFHRGSGRLFGSPTESCSFGISPPEAGQSFSHLPPPATSTNYRVRLSAFSESGDLGFHLRQIMEKSKSAPVAVTFDFRQMEHDWDYSGDYEQDTDIFLPPSVGLLSLIEVRRTMEALADFCRDRVSLHAHLPHPSHPVTKLIEASNLLTSVSMENRIWNSRTFSGSPFERLEDVLVPVTLAGPENRGQLPEQFYCRFDQLVQIGKISQEYRGPITGQSHLKLIRQYIEGQRRDY